MLRFLIVQADFPCGRGARGRNLYRFLCIYHGRNAVRLVKSSELLEAEPMTADTLFIGMPSDLDEAHLKKLAFRRAVLFDYQDGPGPTWQQSNRDLLLTLTNTYLKPWVEPDWDYGLSMGVLPIRRHFKLRLCLQCKNTIDWIRRRTDQPRQHDVAFIGNATGMSDDKNQRVQWLREVRQARDQYSFWGGIVVRKRTSKNQEHQIGGLEELYYPHGRVDFFSYFRNLLRSRVALAPAGNARWSYRHYEAIYAGASLVSTDFRQAKTLIPLPLDGMEHVPDGAPVLPAIEEALRRRKNSPDQAQENIQFLEQYLQYGDYCRKKPDLMDRFLEQLPKAA